MWIWVRNTAFFLANLRICDLWTGTQMKFAICGLLITSLRIWDLRTGAPQKFADLQLRNEPKNLWICSLRTNKKICVPTFVYSTYKFSGPDNELWRRGRRTPWRSRKLGPSLLPSTVRRTPWRANSTLSWGSRDLTRGTSSLTEYMEAYVPRC